MITDSLFVSEDGPCLGMSDIHVNSFLTRVDTRNPFLQFAVRSSLSNVFICVHFLRYWRILLFFMQELRTKSLTCGHFFQCLTFFLVFMLELRSHLLKSFACAPPEMTWKIGQLECYKTG
jgi:hypothetical protein